MKNLLFILLILPTLSFSQTVFIEGFGKVVISGGGGGGPTVPVDNTPENLYFHPIMNITWDITRPNKAVAVTDNCSFYMDDVSPSGTGQVTFTITGTAIIKVNGTVSNAFPTTGTFTRTYTYSSGSLVWT
jgi:hypothetical protein